MLSYSAHQEDIKIIKALKIIGKKNLNYECCEFGAWDGKHLSNTFKIIKKKKFKALLIESDKKRFIELNSNLPETRVVKLNTFVNASGKNSLDDLLKRNGFKKDIDVLSIDIDGNDFHIFKNLNYAKPKIVCIEYNKTIPIDMEFVQKNDLTIKQGSSATSIINLARKKGYFLYDCTPTNLILISNKFKKFFNARGGGRAGNTSRIELKLKKFITFTSLSYGFDNSIITSRPLSLFYHRKNYQEIPINLNLLPKFLIKFHEDYSLVDKFILYAIMFSRYPSKYLQKPFKYLKILMFKKFL